MPTTGIGILYWKSDGPFTPTPTPTPSGNIVSAEVEDNGFVLAITLEDVSAGTFSSYTLDPNGTPRVSLTSSHPGFTQSSGEAVPATLSRSIIGTVPLRLPVNLASPTVAVIDEEDIGSGQTKVRIALSNHIYATDTDLTLDVLAGWRTGEDAATGISVTNNSTLAAPIPIFRWTRLPIQVVEGTFRISLLAVSHHPIGFNPVAGVKFTVTDGTNTKTVWATELGTDNDYGDNLRCYTVEVDPSTATTLTAGLLRCDAEVYPWLGAMRSTDPSGLRSMTNLRRLAGRDSAAELPFAVAYDPAGTRYSNQWVVIDSVNGTATAAAAMVQTTLAEAKAVAPASKPRSLECALQALYLTNKSLSAANGGDSYTRVCDGARIVLSSGVNLLTSTAVTSGLQAAETPVRIIGDPDDADPRANCILRSTSFAPQMRVFRMQYENCTLETGEANALNLNAFSVYLDNVEVRARAGQGASSGSILSSTLLDNTYSMSAVRTRWWKAAMGMNTATQRFGLIRNCEFSRSARAFCLLTSRNIGPDDDTLTNGSPSIGNFDVPADLGGVEDSIIAYNDMRRARITTIAFAGVSAGVAGTTYVSTRRQVVMGNVFEMVSPLGAGPFFALGEGVAASIHYNIFENNTFVGERCNFIYNDPASASSSVNSDIFANRIANNYFDWNPTKHDNYLDGTYGYRPHLIGGWSTYMGVMHEGNYSAGRSATPVSDFLYWYPGLRSTYRTVTTSPGVTDDRSRFGANTGNGDYRPAAGSPLLGRMTNSNTDRDFNNNPRTTGSPAGAFEAA